MRRSLFALALSASLFGCSKTDINEAEELTEPTCEYSQEPDRPEPATKKNFSLFGAELGADAKTVTGLRIKEGQTYAFDGKPPFDGQWEFTLSTDERTGKIEFVQGFCKCKDIEDSFKKWNSSVQSFRKKFGKTKNYSEHRDGAAIVDFNIGDVFVSCWRHGSDFCLSANLSMN